MCALLGPKIEAPSQFLGLTRGISLPCEGEDLTAVDNRYEIGDTEVLVSYLGHYGRQHPHLLFSVALW